jgi:predicted RNase H-like HicB family nuclease
MTTRHRSVIRVDGTPYRAELEEGPHNWSAHVPALPGLVVTGSDRAELTARLREAIAFHVEGLQQRGERRMRAAAG